MRRSGFAPHGGSGSPRGVNGNPLSVEADPVCEMDRWGRATRFYLASILISSVLLASTARQAQGVQVNVLDQDDVVLVDSVGSNRITFHRNTASVDHLRPLIVDRIGLAIDSIGRILEVSDVEFRVLIFPERTIPAKGMSGAAPNEGRPHVGRYFKGGLGERGDGGGRVIKH